jgi:hypothetical protein
MKLPFSLPFSTKKLLANRNVLHAVFIVAILQWLYLLSINRFDLIIVFGLIAFVIYKFNKNMILVLGVPIFIVMISSRLLKEGFEEESEESSNKKESSDKKKKSKEDSHVITSPSEDDDNHHAETDKEPEAHNEADTKEADEHNAADPEFDKNQINYASTLTQNMKSYNELLGSDGFAKMSQDTQMLLQQQEQLGNAMKQFAPLIGQMTPFLEKASGLLNNMDMKQINKVANVFKDQ